MAVKSGLNCKRKAAQAVKFCVKQEKNAMLKKVYALLKKSEVDRTEEEKQFLFNCIDLVKEVRQRIDRQKKLKERLKEVEDPPDVVAEKCALLAKALSAYSRLIVYTGAGVSTAARIPDYRGSNGIWTLLQQGKDIGLHDLTKAEPTLTHMALSKLHRIGMVKHIVSQNCDGLHLRSGLPKEAISEVHGNMYIEVCKHCTPMREYWRLFDVTEYTARYSHRTARRCYTCSSALTDSIVHFGERGTLKWPLNWAAAVKAAEHADAILCIGSSLKVLKRYPWLWCMDKHPKKRPKLYIVNLQWTPKDDHAVLKINARCDDVMQQVMGHLQISIPSYNRCRDPIFFHSTPLHPAELHTTTKPLLPAPEESADLTQGKDQQAAGCETSLDSKNIKHENEGENSFVKQKTDDNSQATFIKEERISPIPFEKDISKQGQVDVKIERLSPVNVEESGLDTESIECLEGPRGDIVSQNSISETSTNILLTESFMEIIYEGVKLKVEDNMSVQANVKINNDMAILCDMSSITCNSFLFNSSYELEETTQHSFHCIKSPNPKGENEIENLALGSVSISDHNYSQSLEDIPFAASSEGSNKPCPIESSSQTAVSSKTKTRKKIKKEMGCTPSPKCSFCLEQYQAAKCLFYPPREAVFCNPSVGVCECCSDESEEEEQENNEDSYKKENKDRASSPTASKPVTNPGWYGKGYRRRIKKKR